MRLISAPVLRVSKPEAIQAPNWGYNVVHPLLIATSSEQVAAILIITPQRLKRLIIDCYSGFWLIMI